MESEQLRLLTPLSNAPTFHRSHFGPRAHQTMGCVLLTLMWLFVIVVQTVQLLTTVTFLYDPAITSDFSIVGLNADGHMATRITVCRGGISCAESGCAIQQHPNVSSILLIPFAETPPSTCGFSLLSAILATFSGTPSIIAITFLVLAIGTLLLWIVSSAYLIVQNRCVNERKGILYCVALFILGSAVSLIITLCQFWIELPSVVKNMQIFLQSAVIVFIGVSQIFSIVGN